MAELGKGDARWIVDDLGDKGTNVNNWHWREYDALEWSQSKLQEAFSGMEVLPSAPGGLSMTITAVKATGDAIINNRKNKLIPAYEIEVTLGWKSAGGAFGRVVLPYISDENHDEVPEIRFSSETDDAESAKLREAFHAEGKKAIIAKVDAFVKELRAGGPVAAGAKPAEAAKPKLSSASEAEVKKPAAAPAAKKAASSSTSQSLNLTQKYYARAGDLYECFTNQGKLCAFTQSQAIVEPKPGGKFSWYNGSVLGEFVELEQDKRLVLKWKFSSWADDCFSKVVIDLETPEHGTTILKMQQTGIPYEDKFGQATIEQTEKGWQQQVFNRIRQVFGYGV